MRGAEFLILAGQQTLGFLTGDLTGVALGHDLYILVIELVAQVEEGGDDHANDGHQSVDDPQTLGGHIAELNVHFSQFGEAVGLDGGEGEQTQQEQRQRRGNSAGDLHGKGLNGEGNALGADAGLVLAVFGTVGGEHEGQHAHQTHRNGTDAGEHHEQRAVFVAHEIDHKAKDDIDDIAPEQRLELIQLLQNGGHQHGGNDTGNHAQQIQQNGIQLAAEQEEGNEQSGGSGGLQCVGGHIAAVISQQVLVLAQVGEHLLEAEITLILIRMVIALLAEDAQRHHGQGADDGQNDNGEGIAAADQQGHNDDTYHIAGAGEDTVDAQKQITLAQAVGHGVEHGVGRHVGEGVDGVPQQIGHGKPDELAGFAETTGDGKHRNGHHGDKGDCNTQPGQTLQAVFELDLVENVSENGIVDGVPDFHHQQHQGNLPQCDALHGQISRQVNKGDVVINILADEIGPVA